MASPDFSTKTIDILAKRARYQCSNPDCRVHTIGPNSDPNKATTIGEAAHIYGAKPGSKRYDQEMSDVTRAAITNGIWLCRNCHAQVDRDAVKFPADLLFAWRQQHESRVLKEMGTPGERLREEIEFANIHFLSPYPAIIQRIIIDKPEAWEWRFVSELMRHLNKPHFKRLKNLRNGQYFKPLAHIRPDEFLSWFAERAYIMRNLVGPLSRLLDRLTESWGKPGEAGNIEEMHDTCILIRDLLASMVDHEEVLRFTQLPEEAEELRALLKDAIGRNLGSLESMPHRIDQVVAMINTDHGGTEENPRIITLDFPFELPNNFNTRVDHALETYINTIEH